MNKKKYPHNENNIFSLTVFFTLLVFVIFIVTMLIIGGIIFGLVKLGWWQPFVNLRLPVFVIFFFIASIIIGTIVAILISNIPLKPINRLVWGLKRLSNGEYNTKIDLGNYSVLKELTDSFNSLAEELKDTEMLRSDFINNFSHEFKTPIVSIRGFAKLLQKDDLTPSQRQEYLDVIVEESTRLSTMATNVLNLTKVENQAILTDISKYNLSEQIRNCILLLEKKWSQKNITVEADFPEYMINANEEMLKQVWINIIDNAIKFSYQYGEIKVMIEELTDDYLITIINHGEIISKEDQQKIFNKFYQADTSHASEGTGVGLAIVKKIIELHHGIVGVKSNEEETSFIIKISKC